MRVNIEVGPNLGALWTRTLDIWEGKSLRRIEAAVEGLDTASDQLQDQVEQSKEKKRGT